MRKIEFLPYPTSNSRSIRFNAGQKTHVEVLRCWAFSCLYLYDDADNMFFDEIHNKRLLQIMPLNTSLSLLSILSLVWKSHLSSSESLRTPPDLFNRRHDDSLLEASTWEREARDEIQSLHWLSAAASARCLPLSFFFLLITNPFGRALSSGLSTWLSKYYPVRARARVVSTPIERGRRRRQHPREQRNRNAFESLGQRGEETFSRSWRGSIAVLHLYTRATRNGKKRLATIERGKELSKRKNEREREAREKENSEAQNTTWVIKIKVLKE